MKWYQNYGSSFSASNPTEIANMFNHYFHSVFQFSDSNIDETHFSTSNDDQSTNIISGIELTPDEVYHVLSNLDENKATRPDKIPAILLKNCHLVFLCHYVSYSIKAWLLANFPVNGNFQTLYQSRRDVGMMRLPIIDQFPYCIWCSKPLNDVSTTN